MRPPDREPRDPFTFLIGFAFGAVIVGSIVLGVCMGWL